MLLFILNYTALVLYLVMGINLYRANPGEKINRLFLSVCGLFAFAIFNEMASSQIADPQVSYLFFKIAQIGWLNYPGCLLTLALLVNKKHSLVHHPVYKWLIFIPGIVATVLELLIDDYYMQGTRALCIMYNAGYAYIYLYHLISIILVVQWRKNAPSRREEKQADIIIRAGIIALVIGMINDVVLDKIIPNYPLTDQFIFLIIIFAFWYAHVQYKFLGVSSLISTEDIINRIEEIVLVVSPAGCVAQINPAGEKVLRQGSKEILGRKIESIINLNFKEILQETTKQESCLWEEELYLSGGSNTRVPVKVSATAIKDKTGDLAGILIICEDQTLVKALRHEIRKRRVKERELNFLSLHDSLTGLHNRTCFEQQMRSQKGECSIIVCDVDGLKFINDTLGHEAGDHLLVTVGSIINSSIDENASLFRIGGDEFAVLIPTSDREKVQELCAAINRSVSLYNQDNPHFIISMSIGYAMRTDARGDINELFKEADDNMYREKLNHIQSFRNHMVQGMMKTLEARDFITEGHAERLKELILRLGSHTGLPPDVLTKLQLLAQFHDIGKVGISDKILFKPGLLTQSEREEMQRHSEIGYRIAQSIPDLSVIADLILKHHEYWNGTGYPLGIKGEDIPIECRILAIVDAFDAMTNDRPYRRAMPHNAAVEEIKSQAGKQFDPELVKIFTDMLYNDINFLAG